MPTTAQAALRWLPRELHLELGKCLDHQSMGRLSCTCKYFRESLREDLKRRAKAHALAPDDVYAQIFGFEAHRGASGQDRQRRDEARRELMENTPQPMVAAIEAERYDVVKAYLDAGVSADSVALDGDRLLEVAGMNPSVSLTRLLLEYGADPNLPPNPPPRYATNTSTVLDSLLDPDEDIAQVLLEHGAKFTVGEVFQALSSMESGPKLLQLALDNGTDLRAMDPLRTAAGCGTPAVVEMMAAYAPDLLNHQERGGRTALEHALGSRKPQNALQLLRLGIPIAPSPAFFRDGLEEAIQMGYSEVVDEMLSRPELECPGWRAELARCIDLAKTRGTWDILAALLRAYRGTGARCLPQCLQHYEQELVRAREQVKHYERLSALLQSVVGRDLTPNPK
ncbi:ankyrin [Aspergillus sclerotiicarbonarius CBS 121057]|uniref:Ankyrin n=1 Tax=Aspergillus sclerotiicarbonarius (strain CBS 121057 / IBT 28362) TaxID=1448318 RepID=A0A319ED30_ASPSB|nr:ankyrin [Aspergillus sclerotiicarbonarius CBS 121057]